MSDESDWVLIQLGDVLARRQGMPPKLPVPRASFETIAETGLKMDLARNWVKDFLTTSDVAKSGTWRKQNSSLVSSLEAFVDKAPLWERSQKAFSERDFEKAISALKRIVAMDPEDHAARMNLASAQANVGDYVQSLKSFKAVYKTFEGDADFHASVGHVQLALQGRDDAIGEMVLALEAKADCQPALDALVQLGILIANYDNPRDANSLTYVRADSLLTYLADVWSAAPRDAGYFLEQVAYHEREGRHAVALTAAEHALEAGASGAILERAELARITALRALGKSADALVLADAYVTRAPDSSGAHVERARCLAALGRHNEVGAAVDRALALDPGDQSALHLKFWPPDVSDIATLAAAIPKLQAFANANASCAGVWRALARAYAAIHRSDECFDVFAKAVAQAPDDDDLRSEYWTELGREQRFAEILDDAAKLNNLGKRDWKVRWNEAEAYVGLGRKVEARAAFSAINFDESLHVDVRKRAKRAVTQMDGS